MIPFIQWKKKRKRVKKPDEVLKTTFLSLISHEIKTPMNGIVGFTSMLEKNRSLDDEAQTYIRIIRDSCRQLEAVIDNIVDVAKVKNGDVKLTSFSFDPGELLFDLQHALSYMAEEKGISLNIETDPACHACYTDRNKLKQIFYNLAQNAIRFTEHGTVTMGYRLNTKTQKTCFYVEDTGIGISPEYQHLIYEDFTQADNRLSREKGGLGVGLSIAKAYVALLEGEIGVQSQTNHGTRFEFTIPERQ